MASPYDLTSNSKSYNSPIKINRSSITAKRFQFLDNETNLATSDFFDQTTEGILNSPNNELKIPSPGIESFLANLTQSVDLSSLTNKIPGMDSIRKTRDMLPNMSDMSNLLPQELSNKMSSLLPGDRLGGSFLNQLSSGCKERAGSWGSTGRRYREYNEYNGNRRYSDSPCSSDIFGNAINSYTGGKFDSKFSNINEQYSNLTSLSSFGSNIGMDGVFGALSEKMGLDPNVLSRASGSLMGNLSSRGDIMGLMDVASSSGGLHTMLENPSSIVSVLNSFAIPNQVRQNDMGDFADEFDGSLSNIDSRWKQSDFDDLISTNGVSSPNMSDLFRTKTMNNVFTEDQLNHPVIDDSAFLSISF